MDLRISYQQQIHWSLHGFDQKLTQEEARTIMTHPMEIVVLTIQDRVIPGIHNDPVQDRMILNMGEGKVFPNLNMKKLTVHFN